MKAFGELALEVICGNEGAHGGFEVDQDSRPRLNSDDADGSYHFPDTVQGNTEGVAGLVGEKTFTWIVSPSVNDHSFVSLGPE